MASQWVLRWGYWMSRKPAIKGIYRLKDGGYCGRKRFLGPSGVVAKYGIYPDAKTPLEAAQRLEEVTAAARAEAMGESPPRQLWSDFAVSRLEERMDRGKVRSEATVDRWKDAIDLFASEWGHHDVRDVKRTHIDRWLRTKVKIWMTTGRTVIRKRRVGDGPRRKRELREVEVTTVIKPTTVNGWLRVLRAICNAAKVKLDLPKSAFEGIEFFDEGRIYTHEQPNALPPELVPMFMATALAKYPQHYAMILLGMVTGLRPSSMRALRRSGPLADIDWKSGRLLVRRSHSRKQVVMDRTKTGKDGAIMLPDSVLEVLRRHVSELVGAQLTSDLLFPTETGGHRTRNVLAKPFAAIAKAMGLPFRLTPRGMRRTFNDLARTLNVHDAVTRSISGHSTTTMQLHYSTAQSSEQREALEKTHALVAGQTKEPSE